MRVYAAGTYASCSFCQNKAAQFLYVLESFFYFSEWQKKLIKNPWFLLDSGAFTFLAQGSVSTDIPGYVARYIDFINKNDIKLFFELDIDAIVGLSKTEKIREKIERETGKKCIPVWHKQRGVQYWKNITQDYDYCAIGGIVTREIKKKEWDVFFGLLSIAHKNKCEVHGLGLGAINAIKKYPFDSVDSTSWDGRRNGQLIHFQNGILRRYCGKEGQRMKCGKEATINNIEQMIKFQKYAREYY